MGAPEGAARDSRRASERASAQEAVFRVGRRGTGDGGQGRPVAAQGPQDARERGHGRPGGQADAMRRRGGRLGRRGSDGRSRPEARPRGSRAGAASGRASDRRATRRQAARGGAQRDRGDPFRATARMGCGASERGRRRRGESPGDGRGLWSGSEYSPTAIPMSYACGIPPFRGTHALSSCDAQPRAGRREETPWTASIACRRR